LIVVLNLQVLFFILQSNNLAQIYIMEGPIMISFYHSHNFQKASIILSFILVVMLFSVKIGLTQGAGNALNFDGYDGSVGEYVDFGSAPALRILGDLTIETWVFVASAPTTSIYSLVTYGNHRSGSEVEEDNQLYRLDIYPGEGLRIVHEYNDGMGNPAADVVVQASTGGLSMIYGQWVHIAVIRNASNNTYQFVINGVAGSATSYSANPTGGNAGIGVLGGGFGSSGTPNIPIAQGYLDGVLDEVRIWNAALSPTTIQDWMNKKVITSHPNYSNLQGYWRLDESLVSDGAVDETGNNDGILRNMEDADRITSTAPIGDASIFAESADITETTSVPIDVTFGTGDEAPGSGYSLATIQVNESPNSTTGLLTYSPQTYWELWSENEVFDGTFTATVQFHYDNISGIGDETSLSLYRRDDATSSWVLISSTVNNESVNTDGIGSLEITITETISGGFSGQYILTSSNPDNPLPVELAALTANLVNDGIQLQWTTFSEINNLGFEVWRSINNDENFRLLSGYQNNSDLVGAGNSSTTQEYGYLDQDIQAGHTYYYQLWDISFDGERVSHAPVSVSTTQVAGTAEKYVLFQNYPNPFNPLTHIRFQINDINLDHGTSVPVNLNIYDLLGRKVKTLVNQDLNIGDYTMTWDGTNDFQQNVASGSYIYMLQIGDQKVTKQLILVR
jgi:hypothetical protein